MLRDMAFPSIYAYASPRPYRRTKVLVRQSYAQSVQLTRALATHGSRRARPAEPGAKEGQGRLPCGVADVSLPRPPTRAMTTRVPKTLPSHARPVGWKAQ